nr:hypothetical protein [Clostridium frigoris]
MKDMLLSAQENGTPISDIVGNDIKSFCEDIVKSYNNKSVKLLYVLKKMNIDLCFLLIITFLFEAFGLEVESSTIVTVLLTWFLYKYILNFFYKKLCLKFKGLKNKIICILLIVSGSMLCLFPIELIIIKYCNLQLNGYYVAIICVFFILINHIICKRLDNKFKWYNYFV